MSLSEVRLHLMTGGPDQVMIADNPTEKDGAEKHHKNKLEEQ